MKPTVIAGGSGDNAHNNPAANNNNPNNGHSQDGDNNNHNSHGSRAFPHFQSGFGFGPSMVDDIFADDDFRPHTTTRMRDPWGFGARKRCGNIPKEDPYRRYFADNSDLFPGFQDDPEWNTMRGRRRVAPQHQTGSTGAEPRSHVFDYIPSHFRSYMPDEFGFSNMRPKATGSPSASDYSQSYPPQRSDAQTQHTQAPQPKFCDASIQTEDNINAVSQDASHDQNQNLNQHGFRNTVDMGQKSPQEESPELRAQSAPPINEANQNFATSAASSCSGPDDSQAYATSYTSTGTNPRTPQQSSAPHQPAFTQQQRPNPNNAPPPPQRHHIPQYQNPPQYHQQQQQAPPRTHAPSSEEGTGFVRHVPIFIEGRSEPVNTAQRKPSGPKTQPQEHHQHRPTPLNTQQAQAQAQTQFDDQPPTSPNRVPHTPQTPHTTESINKIQSIQRDVLNLMTKVEQFAGAKKDKEYMYLDEMLTRNLLKLDTIDTNGKDSIRLARREAIKCIQASINVLEAKAGGNAKTVQQSVMEVEEQAATEAAAEAEAIKASAAEAEPTSLSAAEPLDAPCNDEPKEDIVVEQSNDDPKDNLDKLEPNAQDQPTETAPAIVEETKSLEPSTEPTEKPLLVIENKPPASPKKKIVRKVKKAEKKDPSVESSPKEAEVSKDMEVESSEAVVNIENADKQ